MKRVTIKEPGGPGVLQIEEAPKPSLRPGEVLVEVHAAGVNRPDLSQRKGLYPPPSDASPILGLEVAGRISEVGSGVRFKVGDPVCALVPGGGYAEFCAVPESHCLPIPEGLSTEESAGIPENYFTVWANVFQIGKLKDGEKFLVHGGTSGIGTTAIQLAKAFGAEVFATAGSAAKVSACLELGADHAFNYQDVNFETEILKKTGNSGVDVILDMVGGDYTERNIACLTLGGRIVQIASQRGAKVNINLVQLMQKRAWITGSTLRPRSVEDKALIARELHEKVWPLLESKKVRVVVNKVFALSEVADAHRFLEAGDNIGKVILKVV